MAKEHSERYGVSEDEADIERVRPAMLSEARDPVTFALLDRVGAGAGMHVHEVGAGTGSVSAWLAERVASSGRVTSTDIDLGFHAEMPSNVIVRQHDATSEKLPAEHFDAVHARAVIRHLPEGADVLGRLLRTLKPGAAMVVEDGAMLEFAEQTLPEPYGSVHELIAGASHEEWRDPNAGVRAPAGCETSGWRTWRSSGMSGRCGPARRPGSGGSSPWSGPCPGSSSSG